MPAKAEVFINYGPYETCQLVEHSLSRLKGLECVLVKDGHTVNFVDTKDRNQVKLYVNGEHIFECDIRDLDFEGHTPIWKQSDQRASMVNSLSGGAQGGDGDLDPLCHKALEAVRKAY